MAITKLMGLNFVLNHNCNIECKHCFYSCKPSQKGIMETKDFEKYLKVVSERNQLSWVGIGCGGEVFLNYDRLLECVKIASLYNIKKAYVMTNCFWALTYEKALEYLKPLKEAGLDIIWFSLDAFHQEYIPLENVVNAASAAFDAGIKYITITSEFFVSPESNHKYDCETRELLGKFQKSMGDKGKKMLYDKYNLIPGGRASETYFEYLKENTQEGKSADLLLKRCKGTIFWGRGLGVPISVEIDCNGIVELCPGLTIGDLHKTSIEQFLDDYNYEYSPILKVIENDGLKGLMNLAEEKGYIRQERYFNECHLCYELRKYLHPFYPEYLSPASCYGS